MKVLVSSSGQIFPLIMLPVFKAKLERAHVPQDVVYAMGLTMQAVNAPSANITARTYAGAMYDSFEEYGIEGLKMQILYLLGNLGFWRGDSAHICKKILKKYATKSDGQRKPLMTSNSRAGPPLTLSKRFTLDLSMHGVPSNVLEALSEALRSIHASWSSAYDYGASIEESWDHRGMQGLKLNVAYLAAHLTKWQGETADMCKRILTRWADNRDVSTLQLPSS